MSDRLTERTPWYKRLADHCRRKGRFKELHDRDRQTDLYLTRYAVFKSPVLSVYVHQIHRSDNTQDLHSHPWPFWHAILEGSYVETYLNLRHRVVHKFMQEGCWAFHRPSYAHQLQLPPGSEVWTLVVIGPKVREWGFLGRKTLCFVPWKEYVFSGTRCE